MKFRTEYTAEKSSLTLDPSKPVVLMGSCFSQNMASRMNIHSWNAILPGGTLYNPLSISKAITLFIDKNKGSELFQQSLFNDGRRWNSHYFDSSFSSLHKDDCVKEFENRSREFRDNLEAGKTLIITFGTSICYYLRNEEILVGNCHKQHPDLYYRRRLGVKEITENWKNLIEKLQIEIPDLKIIFTVSPVRHLKDGFEGNSRSKAILMLSLEEICRDNENCHYFPAYEIINDDLRDYRFYASDLVHPSEEGIEYVWQKFRETYINKEGTQYLAEGLRKFKTESHRPLTGALGKPLG